MNNESKAEEESNEEPVEKNKLARGSEDYNIFHSLIKTVPDFLSLTATKIKQRFPRFSNYTTAVLNTSIQNAKQTLKQKAAAEKKIQAKARKDGGRVLTNKEKSETFVPFC